MLSFSLFEKKLETLVSIKEEESITLVQLLFSYPESEPTAWVIFPRNTTMRSPCLLPSHSLQLNWVPLFSEIFFFQSSVPVKMPEVCYIIGRQQERTLAEIDIFPHPSRFSSTKLKLCKCDASQDCFLFFPAMGASCVQRQPHQRSATPHDGMHLQKTKTWCMLLATALTSTMLISF